MKKYNNIKRQRGVALLAIVVILMSVILSFFAYLYVKTDEAYTDFYQSNESREGLMSELSYELESYYNAHSNELSQEDLPQNINEEAILNELSIPKNSSAFIKIGISDIKSTEKLQWRDIYAWIPASDGVDNSVFDPSAETGSSFVPSEGVSWTSFSGKSVEARKFSEATKQINSIANTLRTMFSTKVNSDPLRDQSANYFANCGPRPTYVRELKTLNCSGPNDVDNLENLGATSITGLSNNDFINPWGSAIRASNETGSISINNEFHTIESDNYPYNMILLTNTPSGYVIFTYVTQPL